MKDSEQRKAAESADEKLDVPTACRTVCPAEHTPVRAQLFSFRHFVQVLAHPHQYPYFRVQIESLPRGNLLLTTTQSLAVVATTLIWVSQQLPVSGSTLPYCPYSTAKGSVGKYQSDQITRPFKSSSGIC
ncbi:hypothetical protein H920_12956 [Fukomys damarensis]|uniref:Uncharacterized protein n=1 Tax=Fukomys damarensis TaxID=885580 RepID=A0A091D3T4_FUKDA|nr:hypothetical protein H920_12956 [Fukomys damarensis]